jgi:hypothetical protein
MRNEKESVLGKYRSHVSYRSYWEEGDKGKNDRFEFERWKKIPEIKPTAGPNRGLAGSLTSTYRVSNNNFLELSLKFGPADGGATRVSVITISHGLKQP